MIDKIISNLKGPVRLLDIISCENIQHIFMLINVFW